MIARYLSVPVFLFLGGFGVLTVMPEFRAERQLGLAPAEILALAAAGAFRFEAARAPGLRRAQMDFCLQVSADPVVRVFPAEAVEVLASACQARAAEILADAPTSGSALAASGKLGHLDLSWQAAPAEGWLAAHRFGLGRASVEAGSAPYVGMAEDGALLIALGDAAPVAQAYVDLPSFRKAMALVLETLSAADQRRFLTAAAVAQSGGRDGF